MTRGLGQVAQEYDRAAAGGLRRAVARQLLRPVLQAEASAKENATTSPRVRSGILRRSIAGTVTEDGGAIVATLTAGGDGTVAQRYAAAQEYGATIRPQGRFLAIPLGPMKTGAGVSRVASPRDVPGLIFRPTAKGGVLLRPRGRGKTARLEPVFALVRQVSVPATRFIGRALDELRDEGAQAVRRALGEVGHAD